MDPVVRGTTTASSVSATVIKTSRSPKTGRPRLLCKTDYDVRLNVLRCRADSLWTNMQNRDGEAILKADTHSYNDLSHDHVDCGLVKMPSDRLCTVTGFG